MPATSRKPRLGTGERSGGTRLDWFAYPWADNASTKRLDCVYSETGFTAVFYARHIHNVERMSGPRTPPPGPAL